MRAEVSDDFLKIYKKNIVLTSFLSSLKRHTYGLLTSGALSYGIKFDEAKRERKISSRDTLVKELWGNSDVYDTLTLDKSERGYLENHGWWDSCMLAKFLKNYPMDEWNPLGLAIHHEDP